MVTILGTRRQSPWSGITKRVLRRQWRARFKPARLARPRRRRLWRAATQLV